MCRDNAPAPQRTCGTGRKPLGSNTKNTEKELMIAYIKNHKLALLLVGIILLTIVRITIPFYDGYFGSSFDIFLLCTEAIRYTVIVSFVIVTIISNLNLKRKALFALVTIFLIFAGLVPTGHFMTLGALLSIRNASAEGIRDDARVLLKEYEAKTYFSDEKNQRFFFSDPLPRSKLPLSFHNGNINEVLVLDDYVYLEKFGLRGLFRGFIVFRKGSDIWGTEEPITILDGCSYCWRIRIIDGLYWYHAVPTEEEVATVGFPLK